MLLNSTQARKIFDKYSFLIGSEDVMSTIKATDLFGKDAILYAISNRQNGETSILDDAGNGYEHIYLTYAGLRMAITYCNRQEIVNRDKMILGKIPDVKDEEWHEVKENSKVISFEERRRQA